MPLLLSLPSRQEVMRRKVAVLARACDGPRSWMRHEATLRPFLLTIGFSSLRSKLAVATDLMARHPPWRQEVEEMEPKKRLALLWAPLSRYARLR